MEENGGGRRIRWNFSSAGDSASSSNGGDLNNIRGCLNLLMSQVEDDGGKSKVIPLGHGDPSKFACFRTSSIAEDAVISAVKSSGFNGYASSSGIPQARCAIAEYLSKDLPYKLSPDDVYVTGGCTQAIEIILSVLAHPGANILLPRPGFPLYEARAAFSKLEARHFDLIPERGWEVDLDNVEALADENTVAMVVINPGNPCGNVFTYQHLNKIAETVKKLGIMVIADEVYDHVTFGSNPFVPMGAFGEIAPVITLGSISKRWVVPGWRLGWLVINDPKDFFKQTKIAESIESFLDITTDPATLIQGAVPHILKSTKDDFFNKIIYILRQASDICHQKLVEIDCISCPYKPEGSMFVMAKLDFSYLEGIKDCVDFCCKLAKEESVIVLPGITVGLKNWIRITFAIDPSSLSVALDRIRLFCLRHANRNKVEAASAAQSDVI